MFGVKTLSYHLLRHHLLRPTSSLIGRITHLSSSSSQSIPIIITDKCAERIKKVSEDNEFLRIEVEGGGCSGFQYKFNLDTKIHDDDKIFEKNGSKVVIDETSLELIRGSVVDFKAELIRNSFVIRDNPLAEKGCSCGASFALKMD